MLNAHAALIAKTAKKILPELKDHDYFTRKADMMKFEKNINLLLNNEYGILPVVGMGATTGAGSDRYPHTIVEVANAAGAGGASEGFAIAVAVALG